MIDASFLWISEHCPSDHAIWPVSGNGECNTFFNEVSDIVADMVLELTSSEINADQSSFPSRNSLDLTEATAVLVHARARSTMTVVSSQEVVLTIWMLDLTHAAILTSSANAIPTNLAFYPPKNFLP